MCFLTSAEETRGVHQSVLASVTSELTRLTWGLERTSGRVALPLWTSVSLLLKALGTCAGDKASPGHQAHLASRADGARKVQFHKSLFLCTCPEGLGSASARDSLLDSSGRHEAGHPVPETLKQGDEG